MPAPAARLAFLRHPRPLSHRARPALALLLAVVVAIAVSIAVQPAMAAPPGEPVVWGVQPSTPKGPDGRTRFEFQAASGTTIKDWVAVTNQGTVPGTFRVYAADATADRSGAFSLVGANQASTDLGAWTSVKGARAACDDTNDAAEATCAMAVGSTVTLKPGERVNVPFTITIPKGATPGDHSAGVVAGLLSDAAKEGASVRVENRVGARIYLRVDGPVSPGIGVTGSTGGYNPSLIPFAPGSAYLGFDVANTGNARISVAPEVALTGPFGIPLGTVKLDTVANLVPGATTHVEAELPGIPPLLVLFARLTATPVPADGVAAGDPMPAPVTTSVTTWAVPWTGLLLVFLIAGLVWFERRRRLQRRERMAQELADFADSIRSEQTTPADPAPIGAGFVPRNTEDGNA
ncbi:WxL protein peptidoglycan domain-containing protein [Raineyella sp. W15-4]|uniref:WxL protein peptidoglycan domain-containing protein n=1 Tax=Raineyella sp. W15-4 TaxID=3081651 RepID=UPI00295400C1|nr:DUF916 domain-containing protein [Raineyella sp. W15-4]WOQ18182.1 DUF916 domain-containing protein [Raineyella sp. W15-4]